jgi:hypothetical protein
VFLCRLKLEEKRNNDKIIGEGGGNIHGQVLTPKSAARSTDLRSFFHEVLEQIDRVCFGKFVGGVVMRVKVNKKVRVLRTDEIQKGH